MTAVDNQKTRTSDGDGGAMRHGMALRGERNRKGAMRDPLVRHDRQLSEF
eukprot:COSAG02_NODE_179_length_31090_cov_49.813785_24_plen_50_part_00